MLCSSLTTDELQAVPMLIDGSISDPAGTIRGDLGIVMGRNICHASDSPQVTYRASHA